MGDSKSITECVLSQGTRIYMVYGGGGGDLNTFSDIRPFMS